MKKIIKFNILFLIKNKNINYKNNKYQKSYKIKNLKLKVL
jgi:hypothetical protein